MGGSNDTATNPVDPTAQQVCAHEVVRHETVTTTRRWYTNSRSGVRRFMDRCDVESVFRVVCAAGCRKVLQRVVIRGDG